MATSISTTVISPVPSEAIVNFARGTIATLKLWTALKIAIDSGWGGPESAQKRQWVASVIVDAFEEAENKKEPLPDAIYIEEMLLQILVDEFDVVLEDGSAQPVAERIVGLWQEVMCEGSSGNVFKLEDMATKLQGKKIIVEEKVNSDEEYDWDDEDDDDDDGDEGGSEAEVPALLNTQQQKEREQPEIDEDGFTIIKGRGRTHH